MNKDAGFTLIELMIVVAIIGILAAIAVPNFLKYQAKAKQAEVRANMKGIYTAELTYFTENGYFCQDFVDLQWIPVGPYKYAYNIGGANAGLLLPIADAQDNHPPGADAHAFTAVAWGNIDSDIAVDTWEITETSPLTNVHPDVDLTN